MARSGAVTGGAGDWRVWLPRGGALAVEMDALWPGTAGFCSGKPLVVVTHRRCPPAATTDLRMLWLDDAESGPPPVQPIDLAICGPWLERLVPHWLVRWQRRLAAAVRPGGWLLLASDTAMPARDWQAVAPGLWQRTGALARLAPQPRSWATQLFETSRAGLARCDEAACLLAVNPALARLLGQAPESLVGRSVAETLLLVDADGVTADPVALCLEHRRAVTSGRREWQLRATTDRPGVPVRLRATPSDEGVLLMVEDLSERLLLSESLKFRARHDPLTGLLNRDAFEAALRAQPARAGAPAGVLYLDLDQFKVVNDTLGHAVGDELLVEIGQVLTGGLGPHDLLARLGGDEFGVLLVEADAWRPGRQEPGPRESGQSVSAARAHALLARLAEHRFSRYAGRVTASGGLALLERGQDPAQAFVRADMACFEAKEAGRNRLVAAPAHLAEHAGHVEMALVRRLGHALDDERLTLVYENAAPPAEPHRVRYRELLLRVRDEHGVWHSPAALIQAAERYYMLGRVEAWVVRNALARIQAQPDDGIVYAVNLSARSINDPAFGDYLLAELARHPGVAHRLCLEITETARLRRLDDTIAFMARLRARGCRFALDDFGAGETTLGYLRQLPLDFLKIDGLYVRGMLREPFDATVVSALLALGRTRGLTVVAEHVENAATLAALAALGVDLVQGNIIGRPTFFG